MASGCPVCGSGFAVRSPEYNWNDRTLRVVVDCPACGHFRLSAGAAVLLDRREFGDEQVRNIRAAVQGMEQSRRGAVVDLAQLELLAEFGPGGWERVDPD